MWVNLGRRFMSVHNYMKSYEAEMITRTHGRIRVDEYSKLKDSKRLLQRIEKEETEKYNKAKVKWQHHTESYYEVVRKRQDTRLQSPAELYDQYEYFTKVAWHEGREYTTMHRKRYQQQDEQLVLDIMQIPQLRKYYKTVELVRVCFNDSQTVLGFGYDLHNNQTVKYTFKDLKTGLITNERFEGSVRNVVFYDDNSIIYVTEDKNKRPSKIYYKKIGSSESRLIYEQSDEQFYLDIHRSKDGQYIFITGSTKVSNEILFLKKGVPINELKVEKLFCRSLKARCSVNSINSQFYLLTDIGGCHDYKVAKVDPTTRKQQDFYVPAEGCSIYEVDMFRDHLLLYTKNISKSSVKALNLSTKEVTDVDFGMNVGTVLPGANEGYNIHEAVMFVNTPFHYNIGYKYNMATKELRVIHTPKLTGEKFDESKFRAHIVHAESETGDLIPITIVESIQRKGPAKLLLHAYGFYGMANEISYNNVYLRALEKGWVIAYAHVRGGNEKGNSWWSQGSLQNKSRSWKDLHECVAYLIKEQYTHPALLTLYGSSAGAITVWNELNRHPWLYKAAVMAYPFLDVLTSLLDDKLPLTISDHAEFGNPNDSLAVYNRIESYCPYETIMPQQYPALYIQAGKNDYRCPLYQTLKFTKRFRDRANSPKRYLPIAEKGIVVSVQEHGSHVGVADQHDSIRYLCEMFGFLDYTIDEANKDATYS